MFVLLFQCVSNVRLTLDVDGDRGLFAVGRGFVGRPAGDALAALDVGRRDVEGADGALSVAVTQQRLRTNTTARIDVNDRREPRTWSTDHGDGQKEPKRIVN